MSLEDQIAKQSKNADDEIRKWMESVRKHYFVSCWHLGTDESAAMWYLYGLRGQSIAVTTTFADMVAELPPFMSVGPVAYRDFDNDLHWFQGNLGQDLLVLWKRRSFQHESEVRFFFSNMGALIVNPLDTLQQSQDGSGFYVKVYVEKIIRNVYLDPTAPPWFYDLVVEFSKKFGLGDVVKKSTLMSRPDYA
jgi:hypothetical protein